MSGVKHVVTEPTVQEPTAASQHSWWSKTSQATLARPLVTVALVAVVLRVVAVVLLGPFREGVAVPDEIQYLELAESVASGRGADAWQPGYGQSLYDSTASYLRPLAALTWAFGQHQISGQLLSAFFGVLAAVLTAWLGLRVVRRRMALMSGLMVAALPSQVYWSSVVLRESMAWALLVTLAIAVYVVSTASGHRGQLGGAVLAFVALYLLADVRQQTAVVAAWSLILIALVVRTRHRLLVFLGALAVATVAPLATGLGPLGYTFVEGVAPGLAVIRANLSVGAASSIVDTTPLDAQVPPADSPAGAPVPPVGESPAGKSPAGDFPAGDVAEAPLGAVVTSADGERFAVEETSPISPSALPEALVAVALRPFPWEPAANAGVLLAQLENVAWLCLYVLAATGAAVGWRRRNVLAYPAAVTAGLFALAAVTQGNLGTAFRHRGQVLWALALLSAVGAQYLLDRRRAGGA